MSHRLYDISPALSPSIAVFPGDTPLSREILLDTARGDRITLSTIRSTVHLGSHADAASHYGNDAPTIDQMPLDHFLGPCEVIEARVKPGESVTPARVQVPERTKRLLIRTGTQPDKGTFSKDFAPLSVELINALAEQGVITVGVDTPSVDAADSKDLPVHASFLRHEMAIIEGLVLDDVPLGSYELIALPLKLVGFDASPVRAILRG